MIKIGLEKSLSGQKTALWNARRVVQTKIGARKGVRTNQCATLEAGAVPDKILLTAEAVRTNREIDRFMIRHLYSRGPFYPGPIPIC